MPDDDRRRSVGYVAATEVTKWFFYRSTVARDTPGNERIASQRRPIEAGRSG
jgi:hypothetical protein